MNLNASSLSLSHCVGAVFNAAIVVWLPCAPRRVPRLLQGGLPHEGALLRQVGQPEPVVVLVVQEAVPLCLHVGKVIKGNI